MINLKLFFSFFIVLSLAGCSMISNLHPVQVEIDNGIFVELPKPAQLQETINVSQLISAKWGEEKEQKLLVQLQVDEQQVVLAGFSAWGAKLLSLHYSGNEIETSVLNGLTDTLPKPEQILFNVMLSIWPIESWQAVLSRVGWQLQDNNLQRLLINPKGEVIVTINYQKTPYLEGVITFEHHKLDYFITIETNQ